MLTPDQLNKHSDRVRELYALLTLEAMTDIAEVLKPDTDDLLEWRATAELQKYSFVFKQREEMAKKLKGVNAQVRAEIEEAGVKVDKDNARYFDGRTNTEQAQTITNRIVKDALRDFDERVQKTLLDSNIAQNSIRKAYDDVLRRTTISVLNGGKTLDKSLEGAVMDVYDKGLPSTFYDSAGRSWNIERYAEVVTRSAVQNVYNDVRTARMTEEELYTVLVSSHPKSREACSYCQGKVIDIRPIGENTSGYPSAYEYGYGTPAGHRGVNCRHLWIPFYPDSMENTQPQYDPLEAQKNEDIEQGRKLLARRIRKTKGKLELAKTLDSDSVGRYKKLLKKQQKRMAEYVKQHDLKRDYSLEKAPIQPQQK